MQVIALSDGFYDGRRVRKGHTFDVPEGAKAKWFTPVEAAPKPAKEASKGKAPVTLSEAGKEPAKTFVDANKSLA